MTTSDKQGPRENGEPREGPAPRERSDSHTVKGRFLQWMHSRNGGYLAGMNPGAFDENAVKDTLEYARRIFGKGRYFDIDARGHERVPSSPSMIVSNHSGGTTIPDVWGFMANWYERFGLSRPLHPLAHDVILSTRVTGRFFEQRGVLRANAKVALQALTEFRRDILVMPGGDVDTWRPYRERYQVRFGTRAGYVRIALRAGVPIVPVANAGAHETFYVITDGKAFARAVGLPAIARSEVFPVHLSLPWGLGIGPLPHIPIPSKLRYRFGEPLILPQNENPSDELVREVDHEVRSRVQSLLDGLRDETPFR